MAVTFSAKRAPISMIAPLHSFHGPPVTSITATYRTPRWRWGPGVAVAVLHTERMPVLVTGTFFGAYLRKDHDADIATGDRAVGNRDMTGRLFSGRPHRAWFRRAGMIAG